MLKRWRRSLLAKLRLGVFPINLELGVTVTNLDKKIETEFHILFRCPVYNNEKCKLLNHADNMCQGFLDLNDNEKVHILGSNINIAWKTLN